MKKQRFNNIQKCLLAIAILFAISGPLYAKGKKVEQTDRQYWCTLLYKIVSPVLAFDGSPKDWKVIRATIN